MYTTTGKHVELQELPAVLEPELQGMAVRGVPCEEEDDEDPILLEDCCYDENAMLCIELSHFCQKYYALYTYIAMQQSNTDIQGNIVYYTYSTLDQISGQVNCHLQQNTPDLPVQRISLFDDEMHL